MKKLTLTSLAFVFMALAFSANGSFSKPHLAPAKAAPPAVTFTVNDFFDVTLFAEIPCAGDLVELTGQLHTLYHITINGNRIVIK
ncbi:MAG TPA: hypothetical protein VM010_04385, partial [Chitinophagaceae bacterium]|nr:hypothetical protein [Chitinophagaceae bacterium]